MIKFDTSNLTKKEKLYFDIIRAGLVLYLMGEPGMAKSAISESISKKIIWWYDDKPNEKFYGFQFIDLRLADKDETDLGSYPVIKNTIDQLLKFSQLLQNKIITTFEFETIKKKLLKIDDNSDIDNLNFAVPEWALDANTTPTIIVVEELNRCAPQVRNAALQLLNEKRIGNKFKFNKNVFWMASGNIGEMDKTEVEEMDLALSNRLVILNHNLTSQEWANAYGYTNCWNILVEYLIAHPNEFYKLPKDGKLQYATARSWTHLSDYVLTVYGKTPNVNDVILSEDFITVGMGCVGSSILGFIRYCKDNIELNINDIRDNWKGVKKDVITFNRSRISELLNNLKVFNLESITELQLENIIGFLKSLNSEWVSDWTYEIGDVVYYDEHLYLCKIKNSKLTPNDNSEWEVISESDMMKAHSKDDELTNYLLHLIDKRNNINKSKHDYILRCFKHKTEMIKKYLNVKNK
jgi:hypothetical protein